MNADKNNLSILLSKVNVLGERIINQEEISQIDIDVLKNHLSTMYDLLLDFPLHQTKNEASDVKIEITEEIEKPEPLQNNIKPEEIFDFYSEEEITNELPINEDIEPETEQPETDFEPPQPEKIVENTPSVLKYLHDNIMNDAAKEKFSQSPLDLFNEKQTTIADKFGEQQTLNDRMTESIMGDLRTNIGVNEKFLFINELFLGNMKGYTDFIQSLNNSESLSQATKIINAYKEEKQWKEASLAFTTLTSIIDKRFKHNSL
ncbi:MAG: hypothetical protein LBR17_03415 [Bacteroidales bacterium]|jgi:hypothetical protein|nr:hypothetical protein [Bacteroidales bacterium]